jgi:hypothetical protein
MLIPRDRNVFSTESLARRTLRVGRSEARLAIYGPCLEAR